MRRFAALAVAAGLSLGLVASAIAATPVSVPARGGWVSTGVEVAKGQEISLVALGYAITAPIPQFHVPGEVKSASGPAGQSWGSTCGDAYATFPAWLKAQTGACAVDDAFFGELVGRVGRKTFRIGAGGSIVAPSGGTLELAVNDLTLTYGDNAGGFTVLVE